MLTRRVLRTVRDPNREIVGLREDNGLISQNSTVQDLGMGSCRYYAMSDGKPMDLRPAPIRDNCSPGAAPEQSQSLYREQLPDG